MLRIIVSEAENGERNGLGDDDKECVLKEKSIAFDFAAVNKFQKLRPKLTFERRRRFVLPFCPKSRELFAGAAESN